MENQQLRMDMGQLREANEHTMQLVSTLEKSIDELKKERRSLNNNIPPRPAVSSNSVATKSSQIRTGSVQLQPIVQ